MVASLLAALVILPTQLVVDEGQLSAADLVGEAAVSVGDVARMRGVGLGKAPDAGQTRRIGGPYLRRLLRAAGVTRVRVPAQIELVGRAETLSAEAQLSYIEGYLRRRLGRAGTLTAVRPHQNVTSFQVPPGARMARLKPVGSNPFARRVTFRLEIERRGRLVATRYPQVAIEGKASVLVAARPLTRGALLTEADVLLEQRHLDRVPPVALGGIKARGMLMARRVSAGHIFAPRDLKPPAVVRRGQRIRIELRADALSVSTAGEALGDGAVGQHVAVRNLSSGRRLRGIVKAPGLVEVSP
jgi:flagella basal body P-ring formation protein FlgA